MTIGSPVQAGVAGGLCLLDRLSESDGEAAEGRRDAALECGRRVMRNTPANPERIGRYRRGRVSEWLAAAALLARGHRILARRFRTPYGEIDIIAVRGRRLAFVEVKRRVTRLEAEAAIAPRQAGRIARAAEFWVSRNPAYREHEQGLDVVFVVPGRLPAHVPDALQGILGDQRNPR
jgi:putative endonuclease